MRSHDLGSEQGELYVVDAGGGGERRLADTAGANSSLDWSPDGRRIAFGSVRHDERGGYISEVHVVNADGTGLRRLFQGTGKKDPFVSWSADGRKIAFSSARDGNSEIYAVEADGSVLQRLTRDPAWDTAPRWLPPPTK